MPLVRSITQGYTEPNILTKKNLIYQARIKFELCYGTCGLKSNKKWKTKDTVHNLIDRDKTLAGKCIYYFNMKACIVAMVTEAVYLQY